MARTEKFTFSRVKMRRFCYKLNGSEGVRGTIENPACGVHSIEYANVVQIRRTSPLEGVC